MNWDEFVQEVMKKISTQIDHGVIVGEFNKLKKWADVEAKHKDANLKSGYC